MDMINEYVQICVSCCKINCENSKTLPLVCPKTNMACFAINPQYLIPKISEELCQFVSTYQELSKDEKPRLPISCQYIDQNFVNSRCEAFEKLATEGNKTIYTMDAF